MDDIQFWARFLGSCIGSGIGCFIVGYILQKRQTKFEVFVAGKLAYLKSRGDNLEAHYQQFTIQVHDAIQELQKNESQNLMEIYTRIQEHDNRLDKLESKKNG